ncbi:MAG: ATP-binding protein [Anaerolineae bacterium]
MQLKLLNQLTARLHDGPCTIAEVLDESLQALLGAEHAAVGLAYLAEEGSGFLCLMAQHGLPDVIVAGLDRLPCAGETSDGLMTPVDLAADEGTDLGTPWADSALGLTLEAMGLSSTLRVPLACDGRALGFLILAKADGEDYSLVEEEREVTGRLIGAAVANARRLQQMEHRMRQSEVLYEVSRALASTLDLDALLTLIVRSAVGAIEKAGNGVLHLLDEKTGELHPRALSFVGGVRPDVSGRSRMKVGQGVAGLALATGEVVSVPDVSVDPRFIRVGAVRHFASMMVAPLKLGDRRIGTLSVDSQEVYAFSPTDEHLLLTLATQAAAAIENARLVSDLQQSLRDLKATQEQLIQSEKLSAIGQLIAGVAHELNNPLTAVMGYAQLLQTSESLDESIVRDLGKIYAQAQRAARIVQNLLTFARQHRAVREFVDINEVLDRTLELRAYQLRVENIEVVTELSEEILGTLVDPNQLQQVFLNLINNAQDAMSECRGSGRLVVSTERMGDKILVRFKDDGPGLAPKVQRHLFEPFFTTKEVGRGTGLGLSICFGIVSQHAGRIWAESELGKGATFVVELPAALEQPNQGAMADEWPNTPDESKLVLVVDDEEEVAALLRRILTDDGHRVIVAYDGEMALRQLDEAHAAGNEIDLIICDIKMPGISGTALYERLISEYPQVAERIVFTTGDTMSPVTHGFLEKVSLPHVSKPFAINELRRAMMQVLDPKQAQQSGA